ncbi:MAG: hypothetical protein OEU60_13100 [Gammaproteobacteria bacterium]|nr:hypothetical protein [Gammaproteobacteria bacterium]
MTRFVAISLRPYHTWAMRIALTLLLLAAAAILPLRANAFDLEENLKAQHVQYEGQPLLFAAKDGMSLSQATASVRSRLKPGDRIVSAETRVQGGREVHHIKVLTKDGKVKTHKVDGRRR